MKSSLPNMKKQAQRGFTLVEIAIVLMIIGLLIGGILRGQELIQSARVRNVIDQKTAVQVAAIAFEDRYRMMAGNLTTAQATSLGNNTVGIGSNTPRPYISITGTSGTNSSTLFFQNLAATGFLSCGPCLTMTTAGGDVSTPLNTLSNAYGNPVYYGNANAGAGNAGAWWWDVGAATVGTKNILTTGGGISSEIMGEIDRKADDGHPGTGSLRLNYANTGTVTAGSAPSLCAPGLNTAADLAAVSVINWADANSSSPNCAGAWLM